MKKTFNLLILAILASIFVACTSNTETNKKDTTHHEKENMDPLPSWNEGNTKLAIINYINDVTNIESENFIPVSERIATFDNDGNLWSEQPANFQLFFAIDRIKALAPDHPEWKTQQPFKAVLEDNMKELAKHGEHGLLELVMASHAGMTTAEFETIVKEWLATTKHPRFNRPFTDLVDQPRLEF